MALITINVSDDEHMAIKLAATHAGKSIKDYLLSSTEHAVYRSQSESPSISPVKQRMEPLSKRSGVCKHGMDPKFCKFAKLGKPCK